MQAAGDGWIKDNYQVSNTVTFGSPLITPPGGREGRVTRLSDSSDPIPVLSADTVMNPVQGILGPHYETSRYNNIDAHTHSYVDPAVWGNYDALGQKNGSATITTDSSQSRFFQAPTGDATH